MSLSATQLAEVRRALEAQRERMGGRVAGFAAKPELGTPPHALVLASSEEHSDLVMLVNEEFGVVPPKGWPEPVAARPSRFEGAK